MALRPDRVSRHPGRRDPPTRPDRALVWAGAEALWFGRSDLPRAVVDVIDCNPLEFWRGFLSYRDLRQRYRALREIARRDALRPPHGAQFRRDRLRWARRMHVGCAGSAARDTVHVVPNGVDIPEPHVAPEADEPTLSFTGALDYQPNIEAVMYAVDAIWPRILAAVPPGAIRHRRSQSDGWDTCTRQHSQCRALPDVPDIARVIGNAWVSIAPMRSGVGIKNKVLEAWACARPVVMSELATNGLVVPPDHASLVWRRPDAMADAVVRAVQRRRRASPPRALGARERAASFHLGRAWPIAWMRCCV